MDDKILTILFSLSNQQVKSSKVYNSSVRTCFAHGDFCPWNMLDNQGRISVFDWELAGVYPLGYDLFTCIFQYECLINKNIKFDLIVTENSELIQKYFRHFEIDNWIPYLHEFAKLKAWFRIR
ncbi:MAG: aminoglycoside phosphotransferase family protein [Paludibacter sp.]